MNQLQFVQLLNTLDIPSVYDHADVGQTLPFIAIHITQPENFAADNAVYCEKWNVRLDLYTVFKDLASENKIKKLLNDNGIFWERTETYLDTEKCWEVEFEFDIIGNDDTEPVENNLTEVVDDGTEGDT